MSLNSFEHYQTPIESHNRQEESTSGMGIFRDSMTPINNDSEKSSKSNNNDNEGSSSSMKNNMPSPPLSPYARSIDESEVRLPQFIFPRASKPLESELRNITLNNKDVNSAVVVAPIPKSTSPSQLIASSNNQQRNFIHAQSQFKTDSDNVPKNFPLDDLKNSKLLINPYQEFNKSGFKRSQLAFIESYFYRGLKSSQPASSYSSSTYSSSKRNNNNRSAVRNTYDTVRPKHYHSGSDYDSTDIEKPRTRRFVRQNKVELESDVESSQISNSNTSTPTVGGGTSLKRRPVSAVKRSEQPSPKKSRPSTPVSYGYDYNQIEDFCPPLDTLPNSNKCLKADWKGQSMDLSDDPLVSKLHPAEIVLAGTLRLPCAVYLDSKRRIFFEKVKRMRNDLPFRRTDAQKSCKIDVNKASRLFAAFERVGWLEDKHFEKFM